MKFSREYKFNYTYHMPHSKYCYSECKWFDTELERNRFALEIFSEHQDGKIVLVWAEESDIKTWS